MTEQEYENLLAHFQKMAAYLQTHAECNCHEAGADPCKIDPSKMGGCLPNVWQVREILWDLQRIRSKDFSGIDTSELRDVLAKIAKSIGDINNKQFTQTIEHLQKFVQTPV